MEEIWILEWKDEWERGTSFYGLLWSILCPMCTPCAPGPLCPMCTPCTPRSPLTYVYPLCPQASLLSYGKQVSLVRVLPLDLMCTPGPGAPLPRTCVICVPLVPPRPSPVSYVYPWCPLPLTCVLCVPLVPPCPSPVSYVYPWCPLVPLWPPTKPLMIELFNV